MGNGKKAAQCWAERKPVSGRRAERRLFSENESLVRAIGYCGKWSWPVYQSYAVFIARGKHATGTGTLLDRTNDLDNKRSASLFSGARLL
jgi:hypothetical protein